MVNGETYWCAVDVKSDDIKRLMSEGSIIVQGTRIRLLSRKLIPPNKIDEKWKQFW